MRAFITRRVLGVLLVLMGEAPAHAETACPAPPSLATLAAQDGVLRAVGRQLDAAREPEQRVAALIRRGEHLGALGRYELATVDLERARAEAATAGLARAEAAALLALGQVYAQHQRRAEAETVLRQAGQAAARFADPTLTAAVAQRLGALLGAQGRRDEALALLRQGAQAAHEDAGLGAALALERARLGDDAGLVQLRAARALSAHVTVPEERAQLLLHLAAVARTRGAAGQALAAAALDEALTVLTPGEETRERLRAEALYEQAMLEIARGQNARARERLEHALQVAPLAAYELRARLEWQLGQSLRAQGERTRAIAAWRRAVAHLQRIRYEIPIEYAEGRSSFRDTLEPLYLGLADLLLQEAAAHPADHHSLLREARATVEQLKLDELRDFFRDRCIVPLREELSALAPRSAVLYPILLPERLELLLGIGARLYQATVPVGRERIAQTAELMALKLRYDRPAEEEAAQLYTWLIAPLHAWLEADEIDTLVFVPDGPLRAVPLAALRDARGYVVERYAVATVPGLRLLAPETSERHTPDLLLAGLSQPGPVVNELPNWWVTAMVQQYRRALRGERGATERRGVSVRAYGAADPSAPRADAVSSSQRSVERDTTVRRRGAEQRAVAGDILRSVDEKEKIAALTLPGVAEEITRLSGRLPGETLRDQEFVLARFIGTLARQPYRIVHIASHGLFQGAPEDNFVMTYDRKLDMRTLARILRSREVDTMPLELLVLSACQTAEGDDRTPLGLSGMALQSGARSALGSLWPVSDAATQLLMTRFYDHLQQPGMTKGRALQQAQRALLHDARYQRASDWAAFILVGNWL